MFIRKQRPQGVSKATISLTGFYIGVIMLLLSGCHSLNRRDESRITSRDLVGNGWQLVWNDEFDGTEIDRDKWSFEYNCYGGGNSEQQCYTDRIQNAYVANGQLHIVARHERYSGPALKDDHLEYQRTDTSVTKNFTSARMRTVYKGDWRYGRFEVRAKFPIGQGTWAAAWMLPTDWRYGDWAASGEIDIVEAINLGAFSEKGTAVTDKIETRVHGTLHYGYSWPNNVFSGRSYRLPNEQNPANDFHLYAIEWQPGEIRWYVDNVHYATQTSKTWFSKYFDGINLVIAKGDAPFNQRFHLLLNLAVGGEWAESVNEKGVNEAIFPQSFLVDYVRVYQKNNQQN